MDVRNICVHKSFFVRDIKKNINNSTRFENFNYGFFHVF